MKKKLLILMMFFMSFSCIKNVSAISFTSNSLILAGDNFAQVDSGTYNNAAFSFCDDKAVLKIFRMAGTVYDIIKILVPVLLIIMATIEIGKATLSGDEKDIKKAGTSSAKKAIAAVVIFFLPIVIETALNLIPSYKENEYYNSEHEKTASGSNFSKCTYCFFNANVASCDNRGTTYGGTN